MPKFKKSSGFRMKGYSYPGTSPIQRDFSKIQKIKEENWNKLSPEEKQKIKEFGEAYEASNQKKIDAYNRAKTKSESTNPADHGYVLVSDPNNPGKNQRWIHKSKLEN